MKSLFTLALSLPLLLASPTPLDDESSHAGHRIPTSYESAVMGRRMLALSKLADISTTFPWSSKDDGDAAAAAHGHGPEGLDGRPISLMDYVAECEDSGNPTLLALKIATTFRNAAAGSSVSLSLHWMPPYPPDERIGVPSRSLWERITGFFGAGPAAADSSSKTPDTVPYSAANQPRVSLLGYIEPIAEEDKYQNLTECYVKRHPDAKYWLPGNPIHQAYWARLVVTQVYWVGGFGDRAYIGWIPVEEWQKVTREEWEAIKLPGEENGWKEWSVEEDIAGDLWENRSLGSDAKNVADGSEGTTPPADGPDAADG